MKVYNITVNHDGTGAIMVNVFTPDELHSSTICLNLEGTKGLINSLQTALDGLQMVMNKSVEASLRN